MKPILVLFFLYSVQAYGQHSQNDLLRQFERISYWADYDYTDSKVDKYDSLSHANEAFAARLLAYTSRQPSSLTDTFTALRDKGLTVATADDGLFRIYSWDDQSGGTMRTFRTIFQYKSGAKLYSKIIRNETSQEALGDWYSDIYTLKNAGETFYIAVKHGIYSSKDCYQGIKIFSIKNGALQHDVKLIKTKTGIRNELGFSFDFFSVVDRAERPVKLIDYNAIEKTISIPVVWENGKVTSKLIVYKFTGEYFEKKQ
jgi:hypothetical protein